MIYPYIQILGEDQLDELLENKEEHFDHCISIGSPSEQMLSSINDNFISHLRLEFHDIDVKKYLNDIPPSLSDVEKIINYFNKTKDHATGYTIHCHAGVSRSTAVGLAILYMITKSEKQSLKIFYEVKKLALPNKLIIKLFDKMLGSNLKSVCDSIHKETNEYLNSIKLPSGG